MKTKPSIVFRESEDGDWIAMYVDGKKVTENHSLSLFEVLRLAGIDYDCQSIPSELAESNPVKAFPQHL